MVPRAFRIRALSIAAATLALSGGSSSGDESHAAEAARIGAALLAYDARDRDRAFQELEGLLAKDPVPCVGVLPGLRDVAKRRGGGERARVARLALKIPGDEALAMWWALFDPVKEEDDRVLEAAVEAVADRAHDAALARRIVERAREPKEDVRRRALALEATALLDSPAVHLVLRAPRPGAEWVEESCRALGLGRRGDRGSIPPLIALLDHSDVSVRVHAWESLVKIARRDLAPKRSLWEAWWKSEQEIKPTPAASAPSPPPADPYAEAQPSHVPRYYGIPLRIKAGRSQVVFCLDVSASMSENGIEPARAHLRATIRECTTRNFFDVVAFNERVTPWAGRMVRAHPIQKARAIAWADAIVPKSYTNIYDAVETAFQYMGRGRDPSPEPTRLDAVFVLSDGAPNRGRYFVAKQVVAGIAALSQGQVPVHTIGMGESVFPLLKDIAEATGGQFLAPFE